MRLTVSYYCTTYGCVYINCESAMATALEAYVQKTSLSL